MTQIENIASTYATDNIYILGKGPSIDAIDPSIFDNSLVIGLNDVERIARTDVSIINAQWVLTALTEAKFTSQIYISPYEFDAAGKTVAVAPYVPLTQASSDLLMQRFMSDEIIIEDISFLTALKVARQVARIRGKKQTVYMVGFDFDPSLGVSHKLGKDFAPHLHDENAIRISVQEYYFINALYFLQNSELSVVHVGSRPFSSMSADGLNDLMSNSRKAADPNRVKVVAELTTNHFGDRARLERMIRLSKASGADFVKLQKRDVATFYSHEQLSSPYVSPFGTTFADYRHQLELSADDFRFVDSLCKDLKLGWFASVLDQPSFEFMLHLQPAYVKLPSTISEHKDYLRFVASRYFGGIVMSTGMTDDAYEKFVLQHFSDCAELYLLQCNSAYPTPLHDCNIGVVRHYHALSKRFSKIIPGYSSHDFGWQASALAVAAGARMLEKHVKLGNTEWAHFDAVAVDLSTGAFKEYVDRIRETETIVGSENKRINPSEHHKYIGKQEA